MSEQSLTIIESDDGYTVTADSHEVDGLSIDVHVTVPDGFDTTDVQQAVIQEYTGNMATFIRKNNDYGSSFSNGPKIESILKHGEVREDEISKLMAKQIFVRGFLDKISRFYTLYVEDEEAAVDESVLDTVLDLGNYAHMLASQLRKQENNAE